ncbi:MAG: L,D-transpeptidase family protein [Acidobacteriota bacterium]|nr:L,D-transpeptidase family protein [Acidobacteriota bacterium]
MTPTVSRRTLAPLLTALSIAPAWTVASASAAIPHQPPPARPLPVAPAASRALSNEETLTVWANPTATAPVLRSPRQGARRVGSLHLYTEDGFPEVYMLLAERRGEPGGAWVRLRIPARPNGQTGWVRRSALGAFHETRWQLVVNRARERMYAFWDGRLRHTAPVGVDKPSTPTPAGRFWIREKFPILDRASGYWPDAFGTADYSTLSEWPGGGVVGIHGPYGEPEAIPGDPSHGCIRMLTGDVAWLYRNVPVGAALRVL